jgi:hypothetical protein
MSFGGILLGRSLECPRTTASYLAFPNSSPFDHGEPDAQRRPPNAFILFSRSIRASIQVEHPGLNNIEYTRILADRWKVVSEEEKVIFKQQAAELQNEFKRKNPHYSYKKATKGTNVKPRTQNQLTRESNVPFVFRWDDLLNHHEIA